MSNQNNPLVSIVILNYNGAKCLENCLNSVLKTNYPNFEAILVDNASKDNSLRMALKLFDAHPLLKIVKSETNLGFSGGNNVGFDHSKGEYIVFLNNDTIVDADWLTPLVDAMQNDPTIGLAQSMILTIDGKKIQVAGWLFSDYLIHKHQLFKDKPSTLKVQQIFEVSFVCGASMMIRREIANKMGLFDPKMPYFYDDTLLSLKTWLAQKRVVTVSNSVIRHIGGATNVWNIKFTTNHLLKSNIVLLFDVYPKLTDLSKALILNAFFVATNFVFALKDKNLAAVVGTIQALTWSFKNFRYIWQNKILHWSRTTVSPENLKKKFVRVHLPAFSYIIPSKSSRVCLAFEFDNYEKTLML